VVYELDLPEVHRFKDQVLDRSEARSTCERRVVSVDLREDWPDPLIAAGLDEGIPTAWVAEGLFVYLAAEEAARILDRVARLSAPGSRLAFDADSVHGSSLFTTARGTPDLEAFSSLWKGGFEKEGSLWLEQHGWSTTRHSVADLASGYDRSVPAELDLHDGIVTAEMLPRANPRDEAP
jgi:methyltransferase (TIGR00027 family)